MNNKEIYYFQRTIDHIHRVQKNMQYLICTSSDFLGLSAGDCRVLAWNVMNHDRSKFSREQFGPYIELSEYYRIKKGENPDHQYPSSEIKRLVDEAVLDHYKQENHHCESNCFNASYMSEFDLIEVVCDLQAMAQEFNEGSCRKFWLEKWLPKYQIKAEQVALMEKVIHCFEYKIKTEGKEDETTKPN